MAVFFISSLQFTVYGSKVHTTADFLLLTTHIHFPAIIYHQLLHFLSLFSKTAHPHEDVCIVKLFIDLE